MPENARQAAERIMGELFNMLPIESLDWNWQVAIQGSLLQYVPRLREELEAFASHEA